MDNITDNITKRLGKALEVKRALINFGVDEELCPGLKEFSVILNNWLKDGKFQQGEIKLPEINKKLVYQLASPNFTVVKLSVL